MTAAERCTLAPPPPLPMLPLYDILHPGTNSEFESSSQSHRRVYDTQAPIRAEAPEARCQGLTLDAREHGARFDSLYAGSMTVLDARRCLDEAAS